MKGTIDIYDQKTPLSELRDVLGWNTTQDNLENMVMVLCQRMGTLENRIAQLEKGETMAYCQNCGDAPHKTIRCCCGCGEEYEEVTE